MSETVLFGEQLNCEVREVDDDDDDDDGGGFGEYSVSVRMNNTQSIHCFIVFFMCISRLSAGTKSVTLKCHRAILTLSDCRIRTEVRWIRIRKQISLMISVT